MADATADHLRAEVNAAVLMIRRVFPRQNRWTSADLHRALGGWSALHANIVSLALSRLSKEGFAYPDHGGYWRARERGEDG